MIKAIVFDCFGVLTIDGWLKFLDEYLPGGPKRTRAKELNQRVDKGLIPYEEFIAQVADLAGVEPAVVGQIISEHLSKNEQLFDYIRELRPRYKLSILSNIAMPDWFHAHFSEEELGLFDDLLLSSQVGLVKPDPEIFELAARRLGVGMKDCLFIDDREPNVAVAESLGMSAVVYKNFERLKEDLQAILNRSE